MPKETTDDTKRKLFLKKQLCQALNRGQPRMVEAFFENEDVKKLSSEELQELLTSANSDGITPLHEVIGSGSEKFLQSFIAEIRCAFNGRQTSDDPYESEKSDEILRQLCNESGEGCDEINEQLAYLREAYPKVELQAFHSPR